jgi:phosphatidylglycerol:prolipoprotein diacylglycerol transferase
MHIDPVIHTWGMFSLRWYALCYMLASIVVGSMWYREAVSRRGVCDADTWWEGALWILGGTLIGSRLGYVFVYQWEYFWQHPGQIVSPWDTGGQWAGLAGMSFHGGVIGVILALWIFSRRRGLSFWSLADTLALSIPLGLFVGRVGNFLNGELSGRVTTSVWGMMFPQALPSGMLRVPSQLLEAVGEGLVLFVLLRWMTLHTRRSGELAWIFIIGYGVIRCGLDFFREPDPQIGLIAGIFTLGQIFSFAMVIMGSVGWFFRRKYAMLEKISSTL